MTTTATGTRRVPERREEVWRALAVLHPYCAVCQVSYVADGPTRQGTTFVCVPGELADGATPAAGAPRGTIVEWRPARVVVTRLELTPETWTTRMELADAGPGGTEGTDVTITVGHEPVGGSRVARFLQRSSVARLVQQTVDGELDKLPAHLEQAATGR